MKRLMLALVIACLGAASSVMLSGQQPAPTKPSPPTAAKAGGLPACDADNGG